MLYLIGIGLGNEEDITLRGLNAVRRCKYVYLEGYTSRLNCPFERMEQLYGKKIICADRKFVEEGNELIEKAKKEDAALLVIGDPLTATTHVEILLRARREGVKAEIIHNASVLAAVGDSGLEIYKFGRVASIPFENENVESPYNALKANKGIGLHTVLLLDLKPEEKRYMNFKEAINYLLKSKEKGDIFNEDTKCIVCAGLGSEEQVIKYGTARGLLAEDIDVFPQCLIVPGELHFIEEEFLGQFEI
ncbi:diphthine synthase [archaeon]|nr:diphthine synthase [archaeon]